MPLCKKADRRGIKRDQTCYQEHKESAHDIFGCNNASKKHKQIPKALQIFVGRNCCGDASPDGSAVGDGQSDVTDALDPLSALGPSSDEGEEDGNSN